VTNTDNDTAGVTLTPISSDTTEAGGTATFTAVLTSQPTSDVTLTFTSSDPSEGTVTTTIIFTATNWNVPQTAIVTGVDDAIADGDLPYAIIPSISSADSTYSTLIIPPLFFTNTDNDTAGITLSPLSGNTTEAGGTATFTAVLTSQPTADVTLTFTSSDTSEGTVTTSVTFTAANWNIPQTVTVTGVDDAIVDGNIPYTINTVISSTDSLYSAIGIAPINVTNTDNDIPEVTLTPTNGLVTTELGATASFTAVLTSQPTADVTLTLTSSDTTEGTVTSTLTFTSANWNTPQTVTITGVDDFLDDGDIAYQINTTTSSSDTNYQNLVVPAVNVTNQDNETPGITLTPISSNTTEAGGTATYTIALTSQPTADVTFTFTSTDPSEGTVTTTLIFTPTNWDNPQTVTITGIDDPATDGDVPYSITTTTTSSDASYTNLIIPPVNLTNLDNDTAGITFTPISGNTTEAGGTATFTAVLTSQPTTDVILSFTSADATEGTVTTTLTFTTTNWNIAQTVTVTGVDDPIVDGDIAYLIHPTASSSDSNYSNLTLTPISVTNLDNDSAGITFTPLSGNTTEAGGTATFTTVLNSQPTANVTLTFTSSDLTEGTVPATVTFTPANWNVAQTITVTGVDDAIADSNIPYTITTTTTSSDPNYNAQPLSPVNVTNLDNDTPGVTLTPTSGLTTTELGGTATFTAVLNSQPTADVTLTFTSSDSSEGTVTATLTFTAANWNTPQTVTITGVDDTLIDGNLPYTVATTTSSGDTNYNAIAVPLVNVTNLDDETAGVILTPTAGLTTTEAGGTATFTARLTTQPTADVTLTFTSSDSTEGTVTSIVTFTTTNWNNPQTITITGVDDPTTDGDIPYTISITTSSSDTNYNALVVPAVNVTNLDNETPGITLTPTTGLITAGLITTELGGTATFTAVLNSQPTADVTLSFTSSDATEGTVTSTVTFTSINWNTPQTVTVTGADDSDLDGDIPYLISTSVSSSDPDYNNLSVSSINVTNLDNETPVQPPIAPINQPPEAQDVSLTLEPGQASNISNLMAIDPDGISSYTITTLPDPQQGLLYLGNPASGGTPIVPGQVIPANQISTLFLRATRTFANTSFTYTATDSRGAIDPTPAQVFLTANGDCCSCKVGSDLNGNRSRNDLQGTPASDRLKGRRGNDILHGWDCDDIVQGNRGKDRLFGDDGQDRLSGGAGKDRLKGGQGNDRLLGGKGKDRLLGGSDNDLLKGGRGRDRLRGGTGDDRLRGGQGRDRLKGNSGNDRVAGKRGNDRLWGNAGNDRLKGNLGKDRLRGGQGRDWLNGGLRNDHLSGGRDRDRLLGGRGRDILNGNEGEDILNGGRGRDALSGGQGNDILRGAQKNDRLVGNAGDDVLIGGRGDDRLNGGTGSDRFVYRSFEDGRDRIIDFDPAADIIDLSRIGFKGKQAFQKFIRLESLGSDTRVHIDPLRHSNSVITLESVSVNMIGQANFRF
nr:hypothetical protein [Oculatellaceae cyanobacterium Prado106]